MLPLCTVLYQIAAKEAGACWSNPVVVGSSLHCMLLEPWMGVMIASDVVGFVAWMYVLRDMKLSAAFPMTAISYVIVMTVGWLVYRETASVAQFMGSALIIAGVFLIGSAARAER